MASGTLTRHDWRLVAVLTVFAAALRIAMAQGALWLDEAWSAVQAHDVVTPLGVFLGINHDNNHHLNSLWMQLVGIDAPPVFQRGLAIAAGTAMVPVAALLGARSGRVGAMVAALLFAVSPFFAAYGSEARGYAPMLLALMAAIAIVDRWLAGEMPWPALTLALVALLGTLAQLTMIVGLVAVAGWVGVTLWRRDGLRTASAAGARAVGPAVVASALVIAGVLVIARVEAGGLRFGRLDPFGYRNFVHALAALEGYAIGVPVGSLWPLAATPLLLGVATWRRAPRLPFLWLALLGFPLAVAVLHPANPGHPRYYAVLAVAILLIVASLAGAGWRRGGIRRGSAVALVGAVVVASAVEDWRLVINQRADPGRAVRALRQRAPEGTLVRVEQPAGAAVLRVAALTGGYRLTVSDRGCARFLFVDRYNAEALPGARRWCGAEYVPIASARDRGMTNMHWQLLERR